MRERQELVEVDLLGDLGGESVEGVGGVVTLRGRHQPEVARRCDDAVVTLQHSQHRQAGRLERADDLAGVAG